MRISNLRPRALTLLGALPLLWVPFVAAQEPDGEPTQGAAEETAEEPAEELAGAGDGDPRDVDPAVERIAAAMERSIAVVWCGEARAGTAFAVGSEGRLATAAHVAHCPRTIQVETLAGTRTPARVLSLGDEHDIAMLAPTDELGLEPIGIRDSETRTGLLVYGVGYPVREDEAGRVALTITRGVVGQVQDDVVYSDVSVGPGTSGGPLLDAQGRLVGVLFARPFESGVALAVPGSHLRALSARSDPGGDARSPVTATAGFTLGIVADSRGALVGPRLDLGVALHDEWTLRAGAAVYLGTDERSLLEERTRVLSQGTLELGYRFRFELGEGAALTLEPTLGLSVGYEETTTITHTLSLADPTCDPSVAACAVQAVAMEDYADRWLVRPTIGLRLGVLDILHIGYQFQLDVENPEASSHLVTFGIQF